MKLKSRPKKLFLATQAQPLSDMKKLPDVTDKELEALCQKKKALLEKIIGKEFEKAQKLKTLK